MTQMYIDYTQSNAMGLEMVSTRLKLLTVVAFTLTFLGFVLGMTTSTKRRWEDG